MQSPLADGKRESQTAAADWRWALLMALLTLAVSTIPIAAGYASQKPDRVFVGAVNDIQDYHSHLAKMQLGAHGELAYRSLFTSEPMPGHRVILFYNVLGWLAARLGISLPLMYEIGRWAGGLAMLMAAWWFLSLCLPDADESAWVRRLAYALAIVSSGLGWLLLKSTWFSYPHQSPMDFWLIDAYTFFSILVFPHFSFSIAALIVGLVAWWRWIETRQPAWLVLLAVASFMQGFAQIFELPVLDVVIGFDAVRRFVRDRTTWKLSLAALPILAVTQAALLWPYLSALITDPLFRAWSAQHPAYSPSPVYYLEGYGLLWPLVLIGLVMAFKGRNERLALGAVWIGTVALLVYFPTSVQYRWLEGVQFPLGLFAAVGLASAVRYVERRWKSRLSFARVRWWSVTLLLIVLSLSHLYLVAGSSMLAATGWKDFFLSSDEVAAIKFIGAQSPGTTLAAYRLSNAIPAYTGRQVFFGHWAETIHVDVRREQVKAFYSTMTDAERRELLNENAIRFVIASPSEKLLGDFNPAAASYLAPRFQSGDVAVYEAVHP